MWPPLQGFPKLCVVTLHSNHHENLEFHKQLILSFCFSSGNETYYTSRDRVFLQEHNGVANALFVIKEAVMEDRGLYSCIATNANNSTDSATANVRVKGENCNIA
jgi:hypothetical protein